MARIVDIFDSTEQTHCLLNTIEDKVVKEPLGNSQLVKYTCIAASSKYVALGANSGGIYCFHGDPLKYVRLLTNKEGQIRRLCFAPDGNRVAGICGDSLVVVWELNLEEHAASKRYYTSAILTGGVAQDICWGPKSSKVYVGDDRGQVAVLYMPKASRVIDPFKRLDEVIFQDQGPVVQIDCLGECILVSLWTRCVVLKLGVKGLEVTQVGKKLREGLYGACFYPSQSPKPKIYATRPSMRVWEAGLSGKVSLTHRLKELLSVPPSPILGHNAAPDFSSTESSDVSSSTSSRVLVSKDHMMLLWFGSTLIVFSLLERQLVGWSTTRGEIVNVCCHGDHIYMVANDGEDIYKLSIQSLRSTLLSLAARNFYAQVVKLSAAQSSNIILKFYEDALMKETITRARLLVGKEEVTSEELSKVEALLSSQDWMIVAPKGKLALKDEEDIDGEQEVACSKQELTSSKQEVSRLLKKTVTSQDGETVHRPEEGHNHSGEVVAVKTGAVLTGKTREGSEELEVGMEMGIELEFHGKNETNSLTVHAISEDRSNEDVSMVTKGESTVTPSEMPTMVPAVDDPPPPQPTMTTAPTLTDPHLSDTNMSELERSTAELITPLRSWTFKKDKKEGLKYTDFAPVRVAKSKPLKKQSSVPTTPLSSSPEVRTSVHWKSGSLPEEDYTNHFPPVQETPQLQTSEVGTSHKQDILSQQLTSTLQKVEKLTTSSQEVTISSSQEVTAPSSQALTVSSSQEVSLSSSQEVTTSSSGSRPIQLVSKSPSCLQEMTSATHVVQSVQQVSVTRKEVSGCISLQQFGQDSSSSPQVGVSVSPLPPGHDLQLLPLHDVDDEEIKDSSALSNVDASEEEIVPTKSNEPGGERHLSMVKSSSVDEDVGPNEDSMLVSSVDVDPSSDPQGASSSGSKLGRTTFLSKMKSLAGKGRDRFATSEIGIKMEAGLEKRASKMKEILSSLSVPPSMQKGTSYTTVVKDHMTGSDVIGNIPSTGESPEQKPTGTSAEEVDGRSKYGQFMDITDVVSLTVCDLVLDSEVVPAVSHLNKWMESLLAIISKSSSRGREMVDGEDESNQTPPNADGEPHKINNLEEENGTSVEGERPIVGDEEVVSTSLSSLNMENQSENSPSSYPTQDGSDDDTEDTDGPKFLKLRRQKTDFKLLTAKLVHNWFKRVRFSSPFMDSVRMLLSLFLQMVDFSDSSNSFVKFYKEASEDLHVGMLEFVEVFSGVLDVPLLVDHLIHCDLSTRRKSWRSLVQGLEELVEKNDTVLKAISADPQNASEAVMDAFNTRFFPLYLTMLFKETSRDAASLCGRSLSQMPPWIPLVIMLDLFTSTGQQQQQQQQQLIISADVELTTQYVATAMEYIELVLAADREMLLDHLSRDGEILMLVASTYLKAKIPDGASHMDSHGKPIAKSHCLLWQQDQNLVSITTIAMATNRQHSISKVYKKEGYWIGCLSISSQLLKKTGIIGSTRTGLYRGAVELVCYLDDLLLLKEYDLLPRNTAQGKVLLRTVCNVLRERSKSKQIEKPSSPSLSLSGLVQRKPLQSSVLSPTSEEPVVTMGTTSEHRTNKHTTTSTSVAMVAPSLSTHYTETKDLPSVPSPTSNQSGIVMFSPSGSQPPWSPERRRESESAEVRESTPSREGRSRIHSGHTGGGLPSVVSIPLDSTSPPPPGSTSEPAGSTSEPTGSTSEPIGSTSEPTGSTSEPIGSTSEPIGSTSEPIGSMSEPTGSTTKPTGSTSTIPEGNTTPLAGTTTPPTGSTTPSADVPDSTSSSQGTVVPSTLPPQTTTQSCPTTEIIKYLVLSLGSLAVQSILSDLSSAKDVDCQWLLGGKLLPGLVHSCQLEAGLTKVCREVLESTDIYMWSTRTAALGPHFTDAYNHPRKGYTEPRSSVLDHVSSSSLEDSTVNWGVKVDGVDSLLCCVCLLSVQSPVSSTVPGLTILPCGHCYHRNCLSEGACVICYQQNVT